MVIIDKNLIDEITDHINNQPAIKFTIENESDGSLPMLDVLVTRDDIGNLGYRKPMHRDQYLHFTSNLSPATQTRCCSHGFWPRTSVTTTKEDHHWPSTVMRTGVGILLWERNSINLNLGPIINPSTLISRGALPFHTFQVWQRHYNTYFAHITLSLMSNQTTPSGHY